MTSPSQLRVFTSMVMSASTMHARHGKKLEQCCQKESIQTLGVWVNDYALQVVEGGAACQDAA